MLSFLPEAFRAVLFLVIALVAARVFLRVVDFPGEHLGLWNGAWIILTLAVFGAVHFGIFSLVVLVVATFVLRRMPDQAPAAYIALLPIMPMYEFIVPGFAGINQILGLNYNRVLTLALVVPALFARRDPDQPKQRWIRNGVDFFFIGYCLWLVVMALLHRPSTTDKLRHVVEVLLFTLLPYLAVSRLIRTWPQMLAALIALVFSGVMEGFITLMEQRMHWWFYQLVPRLLSMQTPEVFMFAQEERFGFLRVRGSVDAGIGLMLVFAFAGAMALRRTDALRGGWRFLAIMVLFGLPILFTGSRGTWILFGLMLAATWGFGLIKSPGRFVFVAAIVAFGVPTAQDYFLTAKDPFGTFNYRAELIKASLPMVWERPLLGWGSLQDLYATGRLEHMRQGQGIIDMVNSYLSEALLRGIPGFIFFAGMLFASLWAVLRRHQRGGGHFHSETAAMLASMVVATAFFVITISLVGYVPTYLYLLAALCSAYSALPDDAPGEGAKTKLVDESREAATDGVRGSGRRRGRLPRLHARV